MRVRVVTTNGAMLGYLSREDVPTEYGRAYKIIIPSEPVIGCSGNMPLTPNKLSTFTIERAHNFYVMIEGDVKKVQEYLKRFER